MSNIHPFATNSGGKGVACTHPKTLYFCEFSSRSSSKARSSGGSYSPTVRNYCHLMVIF
ncbi:hypothetical protein KY284_005987 [Solanum tuberosum]|nr:hypothetical protein KY284_005987 [Solanum tuberosum]